MKRKGLPKLVIVISLVAALAIAVPLISSCLPGKPAAPEAAAPEAAAPEAVAPPEEEVIIAKIGFNNALSGPVAGWGLPGLYGDEIWVEHFNANGGLTLSDGTRVLVELVLYDNEFLPEKSIAGAKKLVLEDEVVLVQHMGGSEAMPAIPFYTSHQMISMSLVTEDINPETPYHLNPSEVHPLYDIGVLTWLIDNHPELKALAICGQKDPFGLVASSVGVAVARVEGIDVVYNKLFDIETTDFAPVVSDIIASGADIVFWDTAYPDFVTLISEQLYAQGYEGWKAGTSLDFYEAIADRTSWEFLQKTVWAYPDFDDPAINPALNPFTAIPPADFYNEYCEKYPGTWSAVSWEYQAQLDIWVQAVLYADSIEPMDVYEAMKAMPTPYHFFGEAEWMGEKYWGQDNVLLPYKWPVVKMEGQKAAIMEFFNLPEWMDEHGDILLEEYANRHTTWWQLMGLTNEGAMAKYPECFE